MSRLDAEALASVVLNAAPTAGIAVQPDGAHWLVQVDTSSAGVVTLYDDDWQWLQPQIVQGMQA